jgi:penicillin-binding protein 1A
MGMVPNLVTGVWVGAEDRATHFETIAYGQGATMALPIWGLYMKKCYENESLGISLEDFLAPEELNIPIDCESIKPAEIITSDAEDIEGLGL